MKITFLLRDGQPVDLPNMPDAEATAIVANAQQAMTDHPKGVVRLQFADSSLILIQAEHILAVRMVHP